MAATFFQSPVPPQILSCTKSPSVPTPPTPVTPEDSFPSPFDVDSTSPPRPTYTTQDLPAIQRALRRFVPTELADMIMREAELDPYIDVSRNFYPAPCYALEAVDRDAQWCYLVSPAVPSLTRNGANISTKARRVKFFVKSYRSQWNSRTLFDVKIWFEACVLKPGDSSPYVDGTNPTDWYTSLTPRPKHVNSFIFNEHRYRSQYNPLDRQERFRILTNPQESQGEWQEVTWSLDDTKLHEDGKSSADFINSLAVGDRVMVFVRAQTPGWHDQIFNVRVEIDYSLDFESSV